MKRTLLIGMAVAIVTVSGCTGGDPINIIQSSTAYEQAQALFLQGRYAQAQARFRDVLSSRLLNDKKWSLEARFYVARCDELTGRLAEAARAYNDLLKTKRYPRLEIRALAARGELNKVTGNYRGAVQDFSRARRLIESKGYLIRNSDVDREKLLFSEAQAYYCLQDYRTSDKLLDIYMLNFPRGRFVGPAKDMHTKLRGAIRVTSRFYCIVGGLSRSKSITTSAANRILARGFKNVRVEKLKSTTDFVYRITVGSFETQREAHAQKQELEAAGFRSVKVWP
jgi:tetratricopeptide (TPR) repeat protein